MKTAQTPQLYCNEPPNRGQESYSYARSCAGCGALSPETEKLGHDNFRPKPASASAYTTVSFGVPLGWGHASSSILARALFGSTSRSHPRAKAARPGQD